MIRLFTIRQPIVILLLLVLVFTLRLPVLLHPVNVLSDTGNYSMFESLFHWFNLNPVSTYIGGGILVWLQSLHLNFIFERHDAQNKITFLPALFYVIYACLFFQMDSLITPALLAQTPLMVALDSYFGLYKSQVMRQKIFNGMLFLGIGLLIYTPIAYLIIVFLVSLFFVKIPGVRDFFMVLTGALLPLYFAFAYFYTTGSSDLFVSKLMLLFHWDNTFQLEPHRSELILLGFLGFLFLLASYKLYSNYFKHIIKTRIIQQILFVLAFVSLIVLLILFHLRYQHLLFFIIPFAFAFSNFFMGKWKFWLNEIIALGLVITILALKFYKL